MAFGDTICDECGAKNPVWFAPNDLWNDVVGSDGVVLCPTCFMDLADTGRSVFRVTREAAPSLAETPL